MTNDNLAKLSQQVGQALQQRQWILSCAESCTGGWVAQNITAIAGSSAWFDTGFVTYSNHAKQQLLNVSNETLVTQGAVSEATAQAMAQGALNNSLADISLAVTGIAGPGGGSVDKPVGTVCFAWAWQDNLSSQRHILAGDREAVRRQAVEIALRETLRLAIQPI
jgi:nicotinamide-nucleotide amidase